MQRMGVSAPMRVRELSSASPITPGAWLGPKYASRSARSPAEGKMAVPSSALGTARELATSGVSPDDDQEWLDVLRGCQ